MKLNFHLHNNLLLHVFTFLVSQNIFTSYIKTARIVITIVNNARKFGIILKNLRLCNSFNFKGKRPLISKFHVCM